MYNRNWQMNYIKNYAVSPNHGILYQGRSSYNSKNILDEDGSSKFINQKFYSESFPDLDPDPKL